MAATRPPWAREPATPDRPSLARPQTGALTGCSGRERRPLCGITETEGVPTRRAAMNDPGVTRVAVYIDFDNIVISRYDQVHGRGQFQRDKVRGFIRADKSADSDIAD